ncbi:hypothetical protein [Frankia sp. CiP1_Cm_nod2]|uniref:hypothetical protein n=1 Tax=Frankia sp. CiP1_Cm_nod2 TaxID=2897161 RepID=UPI002025A5B6
MAELDEATDRPPVDDIPRPTRDDVQPWWDPDAPRREAADRHAADRHAAGQRPAGPGHDGARSHDQDEEETWVPRTGGGFGPRIGTARPNGQQPTDFPDADDPTAWEWPT